MDAPRELDIHQALTRALLLGGAERELVLINLTVVLALVFGVGFHWFSISMAVFLLTVGHWGLTQMAKKDSQLRGLYVRHLRYHDYYPAQASIHSSAQLVKQTLRD